MLKIMFIFGTRPEAIKLASVYLECKKSKILQPILCTTGQHKEMLDQVLELFHLKPDFHLNVMKPNQTLSELSENIISTIDPIIKNIQPKAIVVQGDTTTTFLSSLVAFYHKIRIAHVEAGLRTHDKYQPFPEEINRRLTSQMADFHFAPTKQSKNTLVKENFSPKHIWVTGNTVIDSLMIMNEKIQSDNTWFDRLARQYQTFIKKKYILITAHRRESFDGGIENICKAVQILAMFFPDIFFVFPAHLNPNVQQHVHSILENIHNVVILKPVEYDHIVFLMKHCFFIMTDSGGIQEEAPTFKKPVLIMRNTTERPEVIECGAGKLIGNDTDNIVQNVKKLLMNSRLYERMSQVKNPFGSGKASEKIIKILETKLY